METPTGEPQQRDLPEVVPPEELPSYGLLAINHAYNEGKLTFR